MAQIRFAFCGAVTASILAQASVAMADCYVDSQNGDDTKTALTEADAVKTQAKIPSSCTVVRYRRGSQFNEAVRIAGSAKTFTNYGNASDPLPKFVVPHTTNSGSMVSSFSSGITVDGLYLAGSKGDGTMSGLIKGVCVMMGSSSKLLNCEVSNCDIGVMLSGTGNLVQGNYIHDLTMAVDAASGVDPNSVGGAEGIFINGSNNEVAYNSFVNCSSAAAWTGGSCDGGATEVTVGANATVSGVKIHHNFAYNTCGFFEVSSMVQNNVGGTFADSEFYDNVSIDSGWLMLLQVNNTAMSNIKWENNTVVQHKNSSNAGMITTIFTGTSSGVSGGALSKGTVFMTNDLIILDGVTAFGSVIDANIDQSHNLIVDTSKTNPGVVNVAGTTAADFDLTATSPAVDQGVSTVHTLDYLNRAVPTGAATDIGAFEYGAPNAGGATATGGAPATGGSSTAGGSKPTGGSTAATGGVKATGGAAIGTGTKVTGGANATGGVPSVTGGAIALTTGGANDGTGGTWLVRPTGGTPGTGTGGIPGTSTGGTVGNTGGAVGSGGIFAGGGLAATGGVVAVSGAGSLGGQAALGGTAAVGIGGATTVQYADNTGSCACRTAARRNSWTPAVLLGLVLLGLRRRRTAR